MVGCQGWPAAAAAGLLTSVGLESEGNEEVESQGKLGEEAECGGIRDFPLLVDRVFCSVLSFL